MTTKEDIYNVIPKDVLEEIFEGFALDIEEGIHGFSHWARVVDNGLDISKHNGANPKIMIAFGLFHDVKRLNDHEDPDHGYRGGELLNQYRDRINLTNEEIEKVREACSGHTDGMHHDDIDIGTCWDSDRLDLYRVGIYPDPDYLNNEYSMDDDVIDFASERAEYEEMSSWADDIYQDVVVPVVEKKEKLRLQKIEERKALQEYKEQFLDDIENGIMNNLESEIKNKNDETSHSVRSRNRNKM